MTPENDYVTRVALRNQKLFAAAKIQITPESLKVLIRAAWQDGYRVAAAERSGNLFQELFGGFKK